MKKYLGCTLVMMSITFYVLSCTKVGAGEEENLNAVDQNDKVPPVINVAKPTANQVYVSGDSIIVQGKTTDDKIVYKGKINIINDATNAVVAENYYESHFLTAIDFRLAYKAVVTATTNYTVFIEFQDHGLNTVSSTVKVKVNP